MEITPFAVLQIEMNESSTLVLHTMQTYWPWMNRTLNRNTVAWVCVHRIPNCSITLRMASKNIVISNKRLICELEIENILIMCYYDCFMRRWIILIWTNIKLALSLDFDLCQRNHKWWSYGWDANSMDLCMKWFGSSLKCHTPSVFCTDIRPKKNGDE